MKNNTQMLIETLRNLLNEQYDKVNRLKDELEETKETLWHRDSVLSIMYDLVRSEVPDWYKIEIIKAVINVECWSDETGKDSTWRWVADGKLPIVLC